MKNNIKEITVSAILVTLLVLILNPFSFWMPDMAHMVVLALLVASFGIFASFILNENMGDERDGVHRMFAGRVAFLSGATVLIAGILVQGLSDNIDLWLIVALVVMVVAKITARIYGQKYL